MYLEIDIQFLLSTESYVSVSVPTLPSTTDQETVASDASEANGGSIKKDDESIISIENKSCLSSVDKLNSPSDDESGSVKDSDSLTKTTVLRGSNEGRADPPETRNSLTSPSDNSSKTSMTEFVPIVEPEKDIKIHLKSTPGTTTLDVTFDDKKTSTMSSEMVYYFLTESMADSDEAVKASAGTTFPTIKTRDFRN